MLKTSARLRIPGHVFTRPPRHAATLALPPRLAPAARTTPWLAQKRRFSEAAPDVHDPLMDVSRGIERADNAQLANHLNRVFAPLQFPPELASRILTHASYKDWRIGNNNRLSFVGRRVLDSYLLMFLHTIPEFDAGMDVDREHILETHALGEFVAPHWGLGRVMRWSPVRTTEDAAGVGLYKVQGTVVEAVMGGLYHQFGGAISHRIFHTRLLPRMLLPGRPEGLPDVFHAHAIKICNDMGGPDGDFLHPINASRPDSTGNAR